MEAREIPEAINPQLKEVQDWAKRTNRPVEDWIKFQADPKELSDIDVVRKTQQLKNPTLSTEELDFYIKDNFISDEALDNEADIMRKKIAFKREASSGRELLEGNRIKFDTAIDMNLSTEQQADIKFAQDTRSGRLESDKTVAKDAEALRAVIGKTDKISFNLAEGKDLDFTLPTESKESQETYLNEMKRWENEDGSTNQQVMLEDSYKVKHFDEIIKLVYQQGQNDKLEESAKLSANIIPPERQHKVVQKGQFGFAGRGSQRRKQV